jgi:hypothetical protein
MATTVAQVKDLILKLDLSDAVLNVGDVQTKLEGQLGKPFQGSKAETV